MTFLEWLFKSGFTMKRVATTNGGEWAGGCPFCGGRDRFRVWPDEKGGRFWCRGCGKAGDAIQWLRDFRGLSFQEACLELGRGPSLNRPREHREDRPKPLPSSKWQGKARAFLNQTVETLWKSKDAISFLHGRGLKDEPIRAAELGWNPVDLREPRENWGLEPSKDEKGNVKRLWFPRGLVIPLQIAGAVHRMRIRRPEGEPRYFIVSGSDMRPMMWNADRGAVVVVESELDALLIQQEAGDVCGVVALGSAQAKPDSETDKALRQADTLLISLDYDTAGASASWGHWLKSYPQAKRWPVPVGKDPTEAAQQELNVKAWIEAGLNVKPSSLQRDERAEANIKPFPKEWLQKMTKRFLNDWQS